MHMGEFTLALEHYEKALALYDPERHLDDAFFYTQNPGVAMRCHSPPGRFGFSASPIRLLIWIREAMTLARELI